MKQSAESRLEKLEQAMGQNIAPPNIVLHFVRPSDRFTTGYENLRTGETIKSRAICSANLGGTRPTRRTQADGEPDDAFTARAAAAGFKNES